MPKKAKIRTMFDGIAKDYDFLNHVMSVGIDRRWRDKTIDRLMKPAKAEQGRTGEVSLLDVACGTGDLSIAAATAFAAKGIPLHVTSMDISEGMLSVMRGKVEKAGLGETIEVMTGDGEAIPFGDDTFDRVSIAFGIRNFENIPKGLEEMLRVLRPGGRVAVLELSMPEDKLMRKLFSLYFFHIAPAIGGKVSGDESSYKYLPASVANFPAKDKFMSMMSEAGFAEVRHQAFTFGICRLYVAEKPIKTENT